MTDVERLEDKLALPTRFSLVRRSNPVLVTVHRRGRPGCEPLDEIQVFVPEDNAADIPRSFALCIPPESPVKYREGVEVEVPGKQRPMRIKYLIEEPSGAIWPIHTIRTAGRIRSKRDLADQQVSVLKRMNIPLSGIILLTPESLKERVDSVQWPVKSFLAIFPSGG